MRTLDSSRWPRFLDLYSAELGQWCRDLESSSDTILAIARKGPRLVELLVHLKMLQPSVLERIITEHSLPCVKDLDAQLTVADDILTYGSTFHRICHLSEEFAKEHGKRTVISGLPFAVCETVPNDFRVKLNKHFLELPYNQVCSFVHAEMDAFKLLGKPNEIENPTLSAEGDFSDIARVEYTISAIARKMKGVVAQLHQPVFFPSQTSMAYSWLIALDADDQMSTQYAPEFRAIRVFRAVAGDRLTFVAIRHCALDARSSDEFMQCLPSTLQNLWQLPHAHRKFQSEHTELAAGRNRSMWANYLKKVLMLSECQEIIRTTIEGIFGSRRFFLPSVFDIQLLLGKEFARPASEAISNFFGEPSANRQLNSKIPNVMPCSERLFDEIYPKKYEMQYRVRFGQLVSKARNPREVLQAIFHAQHLEIDIPSRTLEDSVHKRLEFGIRFPQLEKIVREQFPLTPQSEILTELARLIDDGVVVPRHANFSRDDVPIWTRVYRVGEGMTPRREQAILLLYSKLKKSISEQSPAASDLGIPATLFEKFCALILDVCKEYPDFRELQKIDTKKGFCLYGARQILVIGQRSEYLTDWAIHKDLLCPTVTGYQEEVSQGYMLADDIMARYPESEIPWDRLVQRRVRDASEFAALLHTTPQLKTNAFVTITTVATDKELALAIEAELQLWLFHPKHSIFQATRSILDYARQKHTYKTDNAVNAVLVKASNFPAQAKTKMELAGARLEMFEKINLAVQSSKNNSIIDIWDDVYKAITSRSRLEPALSGHESIRSCLNIAQTSSSLLRDLLSLSGFKPKISSGRPPKPLVDSLTAVLGRIENAELAAKSFFLGETNRKNVKQEIDKLRLLPDLNNFTTAAGPICSLINDIAFRCEEVLRTFGSESVCESPEMLPPPKFILLWDVRGSSGITDSAELHPYVINANNRIKETLGSRIRNFNVLSLDDGNGLICDDFSDAITAYDILCKALGDNKITVRAGCSVNLEGSLLYYSKSHRLGGKAYETAARTRDFFDELRKDNNRWSGEEVSEPSKDENFLIIHEFAKRYAQERGQWNQLTDRYAVRDLNGKYRPRLANALFVELALAMPRQPQIALQFEAKS
ncbi:MAG: hypothetical protein HZA89_14060 [Verrucomicrobia bacterium]|nr:hypothetical protein [Verrucomicrobiota bacterium]